MHSSYSPLLTDFYQLTMAYGYWRLKMHDQQAAFHLLFRKNPFKGNYALTCGLGSVIEFLQNWRFQADDLDYLATLTNQQQERLFPQDFLDYLAQLSFSCTIDAIPEGTIVFANTPLVRVEGPLLQCQLLETPLLNIMNFQTLIATKASRVCRVADKDTVIEFGMRRAQGPDGALSASRAAYIGGCASTSNTLAGKLYDIPVRGTHAHSWVTAFPTELQAFEAYAEVMPHNSVLLVDTYNTLTGVKNAIEVGKTLRQQGSDLLGIRLDSGNLADLSIKARALLDEAGFEKTSILASNSLDEYVITELKKNGARIDSWGVGTNLATAYDQPALDGVYKLTALQGTEGDWQYKLKLSEQEVKVTNPGRHQVRRYFSNEQYMMDIIFDVGLGISDIPEAVLLDKNLQSKQLNDYDAYVDLLIPIFKDGQLIQPPESIHATRKKSLSATKDFYRSHGENDYTVGLEKKLHDLKQAMIKEMR